MCGRVSGTGLGAGAKGICGVTGVICKSVSSFCSSCTLNLGGRRTTIGCFSGGVACRSAGGEDKGGPAVWSRVAGGETEPGRAFPAGPPTAGSASDDGFSIIWLSGTCRSRPIDCGCITPGTKELPLDLSDDRDDGSSVGKCIIEIRLDDDETGATVVTDVFGDAVLVWNFLTTSNNSALIAACVFGWDKSKYVGLVVTAAASHEGVQ